MPCWSLWSSPVCSEWLSLVLGAPWWCWEHTAHPECSCVCWTALVDQSSPCWVHLQGGMCLGLNCLEMIAPWAQKYSTFLKCHTAQLQEHLVLICFPCNNDSGLQTVAVVSIPFSSDHTNPLKGLPSWSCIQDTKYSDAERVYVTELRLNMRE
jgi:hypothetical protein